MPSLPQESASTGLPPLSRERIEAVLRSQSWAYQVDSDGDVGGTWNGNTFYFFVNGDHDEILHVQGRWKDSLEPERRAEALDLIDAWHQESYWPKAYTRVSERGEIEIFAEHAVDWEFGVTDDQLFETMLCAVATALRLFDHLAQSLGLGED
jgi:hypothetical protein